MIYLAVPILFAGNLFLPWWWMYLVGVFFALVLSRSSQSTLHLALHAFCSGFVVWGVSAYYFDLRAAGTVSRRLAQLFHLPSPVFSYLVTAFIGGLIVLLGSWMGRELLRWVSPTRRV